MQCRSYLTQLQLIEKHGTTTKTNKVKKLLTGFVFMLLCLSMNAQVVSGRVIDQDGNAIVGANAILKNTFSGDQTRTDGYFTITNVEAGNYTLVVSYIGYEAVEKKIEVTGEDVFFEITLERNAIVSDEVIVYSTRANEKTPTTFSNVTKSEIEKNNIGQDVPYILEFTPSAVATSDAGNGVGYSGIRIRGTDPTRINVTINGVPLNDSESQGVFWVNLPDFASSTESIQIQRGVGTSTNGGGAFGASINLLTNSFNKDFYAELNNTVGSFGTVKNTLRFGSGLVGDNFTFDGRVSRMLSDGYVDRASSDLFSFYLSAAYYGKNQSLRLNAFHGFEETYQAWYGVTFEEIQALGRTYNPAGTEKPGEPYDKQVDNYRQTHYQAVYTNEISRNLNFNATLHYTRGLGYYEEYKAGENTNDYGLTPIDSTTDLVRRRWLDNDFYGMIYAVNYANDDNTHDSSLGGGWNNYLGGHFGEVIWADNPIETALPHRYYDNNSTKKDFNVFLKTNYELTSKLNAFVDLQYRRVDYSFEGVDEDGGTLGQTIALDFINPKLGLTYEFHPTSRLYGFVGIGNKEPNRNDYVDNPPNQQPKHETLYDAEIGYRKVFKNASVNVNYYYMYYQNQLALTGELNDVGAYVRANIDESYRTGIEIEAKVDLSDNWFWATNWSFSRNRVVAFTEYFDSYDDDFNWLGQGTRDYENTNLSFSPNQIVGNEFTYSVFAKNAKLNQNNQLFISLLTKWVGKQYVDNSNGDFLDAYMTNDIRVSYAYKFNKRKKSIFKEVNTSFSVRNVLNTQYVSNAWAYRYLVNDAISQTVGLYPQAGRTFWCSVNLKF